MDISTLKDHRWHHPRSDPHYEFFPGRTCFFYKCSQKYKASFQLAIDINVLFITHRYPTGLSWHSAMVYASALKI